MTDFSFVDVATFNNDGTFSFQASVENASLPSPIFTQSGTLVDADNDDQFEDGDFYVAGSIVPYNSEFLGTTTINGVTAPVFNGIDSPETGVKIVYFPTDPGVIPEEPLVLDPASEGATFAFCFAAGTGIATPDGDVPVEELSIGDTILTHDGRSVPVLWIGRQTVLPAFNVAARLSLVRIRAGALGEGLPCRDLVVTADHALLLDGLLINAGALINKETIDWVPERELGSSYVIYHIETHDHDVILAENTPAETFIDYAARRAFDNYDEYLSLFPEERCIPEMNYPRVSSARLVPPAIRRRICSRSHAA